MNQLSLLRHGLTQTAGRYCGSTDVELTDEGWRQMEAAAGVQAWERIVSSPLRRCAAFAAQVASRLALPVTYDRDWREMHFGDWEGHSIEELSKSDAAALERFWADPLAHPPPGAESLAALQQRVLAAHARIAGLPRTLVVTHGGPIRILLGQRDGLSLSALAALHVPHGALIAL
jgi:alpha-ribazole phosphatase